MTNAFERQIHALYANGETIRPEHSALLSPPCKGHFVTVLSKDESAYPIIEWLIESVGVPAEQVVFVSHLSAYPSLTEDRFQEHFIGEFCEGDESRAIRQQKYGGVIRLRSLDEWMTNFYTDDLQYQPVPSTHLAIIALSETINSTIRVVSPDPIPNLDDADSDSQRRYDIWEIQMGKLFLQAKGRDSNTTMYLIRAQSELAALGVTTTTVVDSENWVAQQTWLRTFIDGYAHLWKPLSPKKV